ncbi:hypothetical protein A3842_28080 [Paenibacillus sp. P3E]|uniref:phage tail-collar fiber domain-containing protein n=1 Tax=Paenibacillus sp. P3E TaxID=1349435 RepID=UPI00093EA9E8|nr:phage tail protein [Paenibacillus sp. P3E]OKP67564.1 hypothetical protein A3842_28080 [Paenibacillus sp. P3E]
MAVFGGMTLTNKGLVLQGKAQAGLQLKYTRIAIGDGSLNGQSIPALNALISQKMNLPITRTQLQPPNKAVIGTVLNNGTVTSGFFFREVGVFAQDPDLGEILYAYANAGVTADYIAAGGGTDIIEKAIDCVVIVGKAANISAVIDESLVFALKSELDAVAAVKVDKVAGKGLSANDYTTEEKTKLAEITPGAGNVGSASDTVIGNRTADPATPTAYGLAGTLTQWLSWIAKYFKAITGTANPFDTPAITLADTKIHVNDNTRHISSAERTTWNAKETTSGAQAKADSAREAAITAAALDATAKANAAATAGASAGAAASIPLTQKGVAGGVAALDASKNVTADGIVLPGYSERRYVFGIDNGEVNRKVDFSVPFSELTGYIEVEVTGSWGYGIVCGKVVKRIDLVANTSGGIDNQSSQYTEVTGYVRNQIVISDLKINSANSTFVITIEALNSNGNSFSVIIRRHSILTTFPFFVMGAPYSGAASTLPVAVQTIPDDTQTKSGYLIQKHKLTSNDGKAINLPTGYDLDTLYQTGFYDGVGLVHAPNGSDNWWYINCFNHSGDPAGYVHQVATALVGTASSPVTYERVRQGYTWGNWVLGVGNGIFKIKGLVQSNFNDYIEPGMYQVYGATGLPNAPGLSAPWAVMNVSQGSNGYLTQEVTQTTAPYTKFYRGRTETDWGTWQKVLTAADTASGAAPSTVVTRNVAGDSAFNNVYAQQLVSQVTSGTPPFSVASPTMVPGLNVELVGGYRGQDLATLLHWFTPVKVKQWSRIVTFYTQAGDITGAAFIVNVAGTRGSTVYNTSFIVNTSHSFTGSIVQLGSNSYSRFKLRLVVNTTGSGFLEWNDDFTTDAAGTNQALKISLTRLRDDTSIAAVNEFTPGDAIPSGYTDAYYVFSETGGTISAERIVSSNTWGAPFEVHSAVEVANLNTALLNGRPSSLLPTASTLPVRSDTGKISEVAANRVVVKEYQLTTTNWETVATVTAPGAVTMYTIKIYLRLAAVRKVGIEVNYSDGNGSHSRVILPYGDDMANEYDFIPVTLVANAYSNIAVVARSSAVNSVYVSAIITEEG